MKDSLVTGLKFTKIREYELAWVDADLVEGEESIPAKQMDDEDAPAVRHSVLFDALPTLVPPESGIVAEHATVFVNEPKLSDVHAAPISLALTFEAFINSFQLSFRFNSHLKVTSCQA